VSVAQWWGLLMLGGLEVAAAFSASVAWSAGRVVLYRWWLAVAVLTVACMAVIVTGGEGPGYYVLWMMAVGGLAGAIREQLGRGTWWLVGLYELLGPGLVVAVTLSGGLPVGLGVPLAGVCAVAAPWCLLAGFDRPELHG
jgi:hypothetical protein